MTITMEVHACGLSCPYFEALSGGRFKCKKDQDIRITRLPENENFPPDCPLQAPSMIKPKETPLQKAIDEWRRSPDPQVKKSILRTILYGEFSNWCKNRGVMTKEGADTIQFTILRDVCQWYLKINYGTGL